MSNEYKKTLARFETAVRAHAFMGTLPPEEWGDIERELHESREALRRKLVYRSPT